MNHPQAVIEKAQRLEQLLLRLEASEPFEPARAALGLRVKEQDVPRLQAKYDASGRTWEALLDGRYGHSQKANSAVRQWLYDRKKEDQSLTAGELAKELAEKFKVNLSVGQLNYLLRKVELTRPPGRPPKPRAAGDESPEPVTAVAGNPESVEHAGLFFPGGGEARDGSGG
jgi:transposase